MHEGTKISSPEWEDRVAQLVEQYESQWRQLIDQLAPPDPSSFVSSTELRPENAPDKNPQLREQLWQALASVDREYRRRLLEWAKPITENATFDETVVPGASADTDSPAPGQQKNLPPLDPQSAGDVEADAYGATVTFPPESSEAPAGEESFEPGAIGPTRISDMAEMENDASEAMFPNVPGYEIEGILGRGGMGVVYRAWQVGLNRPVALKMILDKRQADPSIFDRFQAEAEAVARLDHENIVKIYEIGKAEGLPFFSLEYVDGGSLDDEWNAQPMEPGRCVEVVETLARAMARAHAAGLVHRDLKPANVLVRKDGVLKVTDFGLVKRIEEDSGQTQAGTVMGTPSYMAPEQAWGRTDIGPLADVYALGAILYALLTGRPPFQSPNALDTIMQLRESEPLPPSRLQPKIPRDLETICLKALQKDPAKRYASADELAEDLRRYRTEEPIQARPVGRLERSWRWCRRNPVAALALFFAFCLAVGGPTAAIAINTQKQKAQKAQGLAEDNEREATNNAVAAKEARTRAEVNADLARKQRDLAVTALNTIVERVPAGLRDVPKTEEFKTALLLTAMNGLNQVADTGDSSDRDLVMARAHAKMGEGLLQIGQANAAHEQFQRSHAILTELAKTDEKTPQSTRFLLLGRSYRNLGSATERLQGTKAAEEYYRKSLELRRKALNKADDPLFVKQEIAEALGKLAGIALAQGRAEEALKLNEEAVEYREEWLKKHPGNTPARLAIAGTVLSFGHTKNSFGQHDKAANCFRKAIDLLEPLSDAGVYAGRVNWAFAQLYLGNTLLFEGEPEAACSHFQEAVERLDQLSNDSPRDAGLARKLSQGLYGLAVAKQQTGHSQVQAAFERCLEIRKKLAESAPDDIGFQQALMFPLARLGRVDAAAAIADALRSKFPEDSGNLYFVACCYALCAEAQRKGPAIAESSRIQATGQTPDRAKEFESLAIDVLRDAVAKGYTDTHMMWVDPDLAILRGHDEFRRLVEER